MILQSTEGEATHFKELEIWCSAIQSGRPTD